MADESKRVPMVGDIVLWRGTLRYIVLGFHVTTEDNRNMLHVIDEELILFSDATSVYLSDVSIVEYSPMHKLQIMSEAFQHVSLGSESNAFNVKPNWVCFALINLKVAYAGDGVTPDEAINAVWTKWKGETK